MPFILKNATLTEDGGRICYDVVMTAAEVHRLYKQGFLRIDNERQRGVNTVTNQQIIDQPKIDRWAEKLVAGNGYLGQLTWNIRATNEEADTLEYDELSRTVTINALDAYLPDSYHRTNAVVKAVESIARGSNFNKNRKISVRIYNAPADAENEIFYAYNQEGKPADPGRSKWLQPQSISVLARELVARSPHLGPENIDTFQDRLSKKSYRLASFGTIAKAVENGWGGGDFDDPDNVEKMVDYLLAFWNKLVEVRPELGRLNLASRQAVREGTLIDGALAIYAFLRLANKMYVNNVPLEKLEALAKPPVGVDFFSRENPRWKELSVLVPEIGKGGATTFSVRNIRQTRQAMYEEIESKVGLTTAKAESEAAAA